MRPKWVARLLAGALWAAPAVAQDSLTLRYQPPEGMSVRTVAWTDMTLTIGESRPDAFGADSLTVEIAELESLTEFVREARDDYFVVEVMFDSVRTRYRSRGGEWLFVADSNARSVRGRMAVDARRRVGEIALDAPGMVQLSTARRLRSLTRWLSLALPEEPVAAHSQWTADVVLPVNTPEELADVIHTPALDLRGFATIAVDSIVPTGTDTLAYLHFDGVLVPPEATQGLEAALRVSELDASFAGSYVWSTGWNTYVSGATRLLMTLTVLQGTMRGVLEGMEVHFDSLFRFQVRP